MLFALYCVTFPLRQALEIFYLLVQRGTGPIILTHTKNNSFQHRRSLIDLKPLRVKSAQTKEM